MNILPVGVKTRVSENASAILAPNPGFMTLEGTNTYLLASPRSPGVVVVDPGPDDDAHLDLVNAAGRIELILITHHHIDHTAGSQQLSLLSGAPVRAIRPDQCFNNGEPLADGELIKAAGLCLEVLHTPGHSSDSACFAIGDDGEVLTGDTILGRGTTVIAHPDGALAPYLTSLRRLRALPGQPRLVLPAHGASRPDLADVCQEYLTHREQRLSEVRDALDVLGPNASAGSVTALVYRGISASLRPYAEKSVQAQLLFLSHLPE